MDIFDKKDESDLDGNFFQDKYGIEYTPTKTHSIKLSKEVYDEIQNVLNITGLTIEQLLIEMVMDRTKKDYSYMKLIGKDKNPKDSYLHLDMKKLKERAVKVTNLRYLSDDLEQRKQTKALWKANLKRNINKPKNFINKITRIEILYAIASCKNNRIVLEENKDLFPDGVLSKFKDEYVNSKKSDILELFEGQLIKWGIINHDGEEGLFPDWLKPMKDGKVLIPSWKKKFNNDLRVLSTQQYIYRDKNKSWHINPYKFKHVLEMEERNKDRHGVQYYPHSFQGLAKHYDLVLLDEVVVSDFYENQIKHDPFGMLNDTDLKNSDEFIASNGI